LKTPNSISNDCRHLSAGKNPLIREALYKKISLQPEKNKFTSSSKKGDRHSLEIEIDQTINLQTVGESCSSITSPRSKISQRAMLNASRKPSQFRMVNKIDLENPNIRKSKSPNSSPNRGIRQVFPDNYQFYTERGFQQPINTPNTSHLSPPTYPNLRKIVVNEKRTSQAPCQCDCSKKNTDQRSVFYPNTNSKLVSDYQHCFSRAQSNHYVQCGLNYRPQCKIIQHAPRLVSTKIYKDTSCACRRGFSCSPPRSPIRVRQSSKPRVHTQEVTKEPEYNLVVVRENNDIVNRIPGG